MACTRGMGCSLNSGVSPLPAIVRECAVGFRHLVHVFPLLHGVTTVVRCIEQLGRETLCHGLLVASARSSDQPANAQRLAPDAAYFNRHLIGGATYATR